MMIENLKKLLGTWDGEGEAIYPTIETRAYREQLTFALDEPHGAIQYEQKTWRSDNGNLLHWEFGFIRVLDDQSLRLNNTQNNGRTEVMAGQLAAASGGFVITFATDIFGNDARMVQATREWRVKGDTLTYTQSMATNTVADIQQHLKAALKRRELP